MTKELLVGDQQICLNCGMSHLPDRRQAALRRLLPAEKETLQSVYPCWWGGNRYDRGGFKRLLDDLKAVGASFDTGPIGTLWFPAEYNLG